MKVMIDHQRNFLKMAMIISDRTVALLKNFASINPSIVLKPGKQLSTLSEDGMVYAEAEISEEFPTEIGVHQIKKLVDIFTMDKKQPPTVEWNETEALIKCGMAETKFVYDDPTLIKYPKAALKESDYLAKFSVEWEDLKKFVKMVVSMKLEKVVIGFDGQQAYLAAINPENPTANAVSFVLGEEQTNIVKRYCVDRGISDFRYLVSTLNVKRLYASDYLIFIYDNRRVDFKNLDGIRYVMVASKDSTLTKKDIS